MIRLSSEDKNEKRAPGLVVSQPGASAWSFSRQDGENTNSITLKSWQLTKSCRLELTRRSCPASGPGKRAPATSRHYLQAAILDAIGLPCGNAMSQV